MDESICKKCLWFYTNENYPICERQRSSQESTCYRFYKMPDEMLTKKDGEFECPHCGRKRDPEKCWWCCNA